MPMSEEETRAELDWLSDKISTQVRWFAVGVLALVWGVLSAREPALRYWTPALILAGLLAVTVLFADFFQYVAGFQATKAVRARLRGGETVDGYDPGELWYRARSGLFIAKQLIAVFAFAVLVMAVAPALGR